MRILLVSERLDLGGPARNARKRACVAGGAERYVLSVAEGLKARGHKVYLATGPKYLDEVDVIYINNIFDPTLIDRLTASGKKTVRFFHDHATYCPGTPKYWFNSKQICSIKASPLCAYYAYKEKCLSRNPLVWWSKVRGLAEQRRANRKIGHYVVASEFMKSQLVLFGLEVAKITVNPLFSARTLSSKKRKEAAPPVILFVGRVFKEKGLEYLLRACAQLKGDYQLWVAGEGWDLERCRGVAQKLGMVSRTKFFGWVDDKILGDLYAQCRLVAVPSVWPEPFGLTGLEAASFSKPVVAFNVGGISQWLEDGQNGFLAEPQNVNQLCEKISLLLENESLARRVGQVGKKRLQEKFSLGRHLDKLEKVLVDKA